TPGTHVPERSSPSPREATGGTNADSPSARSFREASADLFGRLRAPVERLAPPAPVDLEEIQRRLFSALDPNITIATAVRSRLQIAPSVPWRPADPLEPVMAAPTFKQAMYEPLKRLSQEWLLPGIAGVLPNTASLLLTNKIFVEAYMVGLNHEMAR